jgi:glycosyltransferase involved in cell wall biosynthesis
MSNFADVTVCIASIPPRSKKLRQALASVLIQTLQPADIIVAIDHRHEGASATKNRAVMKANTAFVCMLDDDDQFLPNHIEVQYYAALDNDADVVYTIPSVPQLGGKPDGSGRYGLPFDADELRRRSYIPDTSLFNTRMAQRVGGFQLPADSPYDDWGLWLAMLKDGAKFHHEPIQTYIWNHWGYGTPGNPGNTSGDPTRW